MSVAKVLQEGRPEQLPANLTDIGRGKHLVRTEPLIDSGIPLITARQRVVGTEDIKGTGRMIESCQLRRRCILGTEWIERPEYHLSKEMRERCSGISGVGDS